MQEEGSELGKQIEQPQEPRSPSALSELRPDLLTWELMQLEGVRRRCRGRALCWGQCGKQFVFGYFVFACNMHTPGRQLDVWPIGWLLQRPLHTHTHPPPRPSSPSWRCNIVLNSQWRQCTHAPPTVTTMQQQVTTDRQQGSAMTND